MRVSLLLFLLVLFFTQLSAQKIIRVQQPQFYEGKTLSELRKDGIVTDSVIYQQKILFIALAPRKDLRLEFLRASDSTFYFREFLNKKIEREGLYQLEEQFLKTSKIRTDDIETFSEIWTFHDVFKMKKNGVWKEQDAENRFWEGKYKNDKKEGAWKLINQTKDQTKIYFKEDQPIEFENPTDDLIAKHFEGLLVNKSFYFLIARPNLARRNTRWIFRKTLFEGLSERGIFNFKPNRIFDFENKKQDAKREGSGIWKVHENGILELTFSNGETQFLKIKEMSEHFISCEL